ncbi:MAG: hypothetical protein FWD69_03465 [Polyangiaceae bacterium]|nr:hypothetical protein [Polyangiaceae bacterium]
MQRPLAALTIAILLLLASRAGAYRPFDGTDADVAEPRVFELELGPVHYYREDHHNFLIVPALVLNFGLFEGTELVIDANNYVTVDPPEPNAARDRILGDDVLLKHVFRHGILQGKTGLSIAAEGGVLLPEMNGGRGFGASLDVITSYRWSWGTIHYNEWFELTREHHVDLYSGVILEGPYEWRVRPVTEFFFDKDFNDAQTVSLLVGAIWRASESFSFDIGLRGARIADANAGEIRLGLTWSFDYGHHDDTSTRARFHGAHHSIL